jgi:histidinol dehydrogenase
MNVVPAQVAGVGSIALTSSPQRGFGGPAAPDDPGGLRAARHRRGVRRGGAQAIAMFAYGAGPCRRVDLVTGPGNIYTVSAKRLLKGVVGIDSEAGPTEIAILADDTADAAYVAADLLSQAEHDPMAASVLVTDSLRLADEVDVELEKQVAATRHVERIRTALSGRQSRHRAGRRRRPGAGRDHAYAAEHTEIHTADATADAAKVRNAARSSSVRGRRCRSATTAQAPTTCCRPPGVRATPPVYRCARSCARSMS